MVKIFKKSKGKTTLDVDTYGSSLIFIVNNKADCETLRDVLRATTNNDTLILHGNFKVLYDPKQWAIFENY